MADSLSKKYILKIQSCKKAIKGYGGKSGYTVSNIRNYLLPLDDILEKLKLL